MKKLFLPVLVALSVCAARRPAMYPEPRYDGSAGSVWLDRFLAEGGMEYQTFLAELDAFEAGIERGWGHRPSTWRWIQRIREWERMVPEMEGMGYLLGRLNLERSQHVYLDALTAYVEFNLYQVGSTYGGESARTLFFEAFTGGSYSPESMAMMFRGGGHYDDEARDMIAWALSDIRGMLSEAQLEEAARLVAGYGTGFRPGRF